MAASCFKGVFVVGSSWFTIALDTEQDITGATLTRIKYMKPLSHEVGFWDATPNGTVLEYVVTAYENWFDEPGIWKFWTWVEVGGRTGLGEVFEQEFFEEPI